MLIPSVKSTLDPGVCLISVSRVPETENPEKSFKIHEKNAQETKRLLPNSYQVIPES